MPTNLKKISSGLNPDLTIGHTNSVMTKWYPDQKAIIASGFSETDRVKKAQHSGAGRYVKKPYTMEKSVWR